MGQSKSGHILSPKVHLTVYHLNPILPNHGTVTFTITRSAMLLSVFSTNSSNSGVLQHDTINFLFVS